MENNTYSDGQSSNTPIYLICIKEVSTISRARSCGATRRCDFGYKTSPLEAVLTTFWNYLKNVTKNRALF